MPRSWYILIAVCILVCITSASRQCPNGITGTCKPGGKCRAGSYCSTSGFGSRRLCCRTKARGVYCKYGSTGTCGGVYCKYGSTGSCGKKGLACKSGSKCIRPTGVINGMGKCCVIRRKSPIRKNGGK